MYKRQGCRERAAGTAGAGARRRGAKDHVGFGKTAPKGVDGDAIAVDITPEQVENVGNFQAYGFLPELIARFTRIVPFRALDRRTLKEILRGDVIARMTREFRAEGLTLDVDEAVLDHIVDHAVRRETGARGLVAALARQLEDIAFASFGHDAGATVRVRVVDDELATELA